MSKKWRPNGWANPFPKSDKPIDINNKNSFGYSYVAFELGADALLESLFKLARESPTGTFVIDSNTVNILSTTNIKGVKSNE